MVYFYRDKQIVVKCTCTTEMLQCAQHQQNPVTTAISLQGILLQELHGYKTQVLSHDCSVSLCLYFFVQHKDNDCGEKTKDVQSNTLSAGEHFSYCILNR